MLSESHLFLCRPYNSLPEQCYAKTSRSTANTYPSKSLPLPSHSMPKRIFSMSDRSYLCHNDTCLNSTMPMRLNALLCQCSATPKLRPSLLRLALAPFFFAMPSLVPAIQCLCQGVHHSSMPSPFLSMPMLRVSFLCHAFSRRFTALTLIKHFPLKRALAGITPLA